MKNKLVKSLRYVILAAVLIFVTIQSYLHITIGSEDYASIHALCPYGALESLYKLIFSGTFIQKIFSGTLILLGLTLILTLVFRRSFCGLICPFGTIQEIFGKLGKKLFKKRYELPKKADRPLRYLKYVILFITIYYAWKTAGLWMSPYDPWAAYGHMSNGAATLIEEYPFGIMLLLVTIIGSMLYDRFFCKYLCPMGAFYGIVSKMSPGKITRDENTCINCGLCNKNCPANIKVSEITTIKSAECLNCQSCILSCPQKDTLKFRFLGKGMSPLAVIIIAVSIFFGGIGIANLTNVYQTTPKPITSSTNLNPEEIKGYMTLQETATALKMDIDELYKKLNIPTTVPKDTQLKNVKNFVPGFEVEKARESLK